MILSLIKLLSYRWQTAAVKVDWILYNIRQIPLEWLAAVTTGSPSLSAQPAPRPRVLSNTTPCPWTVWVECPLVFGLSQLTNNSSSSNIAISRFLSAAACLINLWWPISSNMDNNLNSYIMVILLRPALWCSKRGPRPQTALRTTQCPSVTPTNVTTTKWSIQLRIQVLLTWRLAGCVPAI